MQNRKQDVVLVSMPFGSLQSPSIGLSLLKAGLTRKNISSKILYFTFRFAEIIGVSLYKRILLGEPVNQDLVGEWIFSESLFGSEALQPDEYILNVLGGGSLDHRKAHTNSADYYFSKKNPVSASFVRDVIRIPKEVEYFLEECVKSILSYQPSVVGFTSVFQQQVASLSLAKRIKAASPETLVVFGGANCEGIMGKEMIRQFSFVDAVVSGEGDLVFPEIVVRKLDKSQSRGFEELAGVITKQNLESLTGNINAPMLRDMDALPYPDYQEFFEQHKSCEVIESSDIPTLLFETSRGCWWGERSHCTFCGLNGENMAFRSKSSSRAIQELTDLTQMYPGCRVFVVDTILDMKYFKDFIPHLAANPLNVEIFYEVKSNLKKDQVHLLSKSGITSIQPGIESLSTPVLNIMGKGVKGIQNIQLLKWCKEFGVSPNWNLLWGFPKEPSEEYLRMADVIPLLTHLPPPCNGCTIVIQRFSPNYENAERMGFCKVVPYPSYHYIYPFPAEIVKNLAYYFTGEYSEKQEVSEYIGPLTREIVDWQQTYENSDLYSIDEGHELMIWDLRPIASRRLTTLKGIQRLLYLYCDTTRSRSDLKLKIEIETGSLASQEDAEKILQPLLDQGLMIQEGNLFLSLAIPVGDYMPRGSYLEKVVNE